MSVIVLFVISVKYYKQQIRLYPQIIYFWLSEPQPVEPFMFLSRNTTEILINGR